MKVKQCLPSAPSLQRCHKLKASANEIHLLPQKRKERMFESTTTVSITYPEEAIKKNAYTEKLTSRK